MDDEKFWTNGAEALLKARTFAYKNAICTLNKFYYNFLEGGNSDTFSELDFNEVHDYFKGVIDDFDTFEKINDLYLRFKDISKVE